ncbi:MAG: LysR family transcriptional regulator [Bryobacteraceae bacterium]
MTIEHLQLFRDVATSRSISKGAELNGLSQSAVSQHLQEVERQLGVQLVDRSTRPLTLTHSGRLYQDFCREAVRLYQQFQTELENVKGKVEGVCRVASIYSVGLSELDELEKQFSVRFPGAELEIEHLRPERVYEAVLDDRADLGLVSYPESRRGLNVIPWRKEHMVLAVAPEHPLASRTEVGPEDLDGVDYVGFDDDLPVSRDVKRYLKEAGVEVNQVRHFDNIHSMKEAVSIGAGVSILPEPILRPDVASGRLRTVALRAPGLSRPLGILHAKRKGLNRATRSFLAMLQES